MSTLNIRCPLWKILTIVNWQSTWINTTTKKAYRYMKMCSTLLIVRVIQIKTTTRHCYVWFIITIVKKTDNIKCWQKFGENGIISYWWKYIMLKHTLENILAVSLKFQHKLHLKCYGSISILHYPREMNTYVHRKTY